MTHQFSEDALVQKYFQKAAFSPFALELKDDAACLRVSEAHELVVTCDTIVAGVHFFEDDPIGAIAQKALRVNLSDLAAKGAKPVGFVMSLALPEACFEHEWLAEFSNALCEDAKLFNCPLLGGDTVKTKGVLTITITAFGEVPLGKMVKRTSARAGNLLFVTGTIGDAAVGLSLLRSGEGGAQRRMRGCSAHYPSPALRAPSPEGRGENFLQHRRLIPQPRVEIAPILQEFATAALDISDGFTGDCMKLLSYSNLGIEIACEDVPLSDEVRFFLLPSGEGGIECNEMTDEGHGAQKSPHPPFGHPLPRGEGNTLYQTILSDGDDYEVLFTINANDEAKLLSAVQNLPFLVTRLAVVNSSGSMVILMNGEMLELDRISYSHINRYI